MRIAHVSDFYLPRLGGIEMQVHDLAVRQQAAGHQVEVITTSPGTPAGRDVEDGVLVHRLSDRSLLPVEVRPGVLRAGRALLRENKYDVVHVHAGPVSPLAFAVTELAAEFPTVVTAHSLLHRLEPAFRALDTAAGWSRWPAVWTAVSEVAAAPLRRLVAPAPVYVLPNGIDADRWRVEPHRPGAFGNPLGAGRFGGNLFGGDHLADDPFGGDRFAGGPFGAGRFGGNRFGGGRSGGREVLVVAVMRLAARKRGLPLLRLLQRAQAALPLSTRLRVVIAGDGPQRGSMERYLRRHDMTGWVSLPGRLSRPEIKVLFARADIFVAPATLESFGIAALEARCGGLPVIARAEGGISEFIADGREGLLVASDAEMADAIATLAVEEVKREGIATHNRVTPPPVAWPDVLARTTDLYGLAAERRALIDA